MSRTDWPQECPLSRGAIIGDDKGRNCYMDREIDPQGTYHEIRRRWRIEPAAVRLSDALDSYLKADHNSDARKLETDYIELLDAQRNFEKESKK